MCVQGESLAHGAHHEAAHSGWSRRQFIRGLAMAGGTVALGLNGIPVRAARPAPLTAALLGSDPDRILVLIQLAGGNDGLNTVIPIGNDLYQNGRPGLAIRDSDAIRLSDDAGLHPSMGLWETLYKDGNLGIVQNVGYPDSDLSHFVSTDVWLSAGEAYDQGGTGWMGRYLLEEYPEFDTTPPDHPIALQIGSASPLLFQSPTHAMGVTFPSVSMLSRLAEGGSLFDDQNVPDSLLGDELAYVRRVSNNSFGYAQSIKQAYDQGANRVGYSGHSLAANLRTVARLIRGGLGARVYHVTLGGFDTHANQAGTHSTLLRYLAEATTQFYYDLAADGHAERVLAMTFSEFGRRVRSNASNGTDHGTAAPLFVIGGSVQGGLYGGLPDLVNVDANFNLIPTVDFRGVYASVFEGWFGVDAGESSRLLGGAYAAPPLFGASATSAPQAPVDVPSEAVLDAVYPSPATSRFRVEATVPAGVVAELYLVDASGRRISVQARRSGGATDRAWDVELPGRLASGSYLVVLEADGRRLSRPLVVVR